MVIVLQLAGVVAALIGVVAFYYGIPVKEFSFGNTLILVGTISLCTGTILFALSVVALELRAAASRLVSGQEPRLRAALPPFPAVATMGEGQAFSRDQAPSSGPNVAPLDPPAAPATWEDDPPARLDAPEPPQPRKRNLMFSSSVRKDRDRLSRLGDPGPGTPSTPETDEVQPPDFDRDWPKPERARGAQIPAQRRANRLAAVPSESSSLPAPPPEGEPPAVTVLKSGTVDGMAYSLFSDGSIEAEMPEGMMRFASIDELRAHLEQRS